MNKIFTGSTIGYGSTLPASASSTDGTLFFLSADYTDAAGSPTNPTALPILRTSGLYLYNFARDISTSIIGDQVGFGWQQMTAVGALGGTYVSIIGDTMTGPLVLASTGAGLTVQSTAPEIRFSETGQPVNAGLWAMIVDGQAFSLSSRTDAGALTTDLFRITRAGILSTNGNTIWHAGNDGVGSSVDAGLFAGQLPAFYLGAANHTGVVPLNRGGTGSTSFTDGGVIYVSNATTLTSTLAPTAANQILTSSASGNENVPTWTASTSLNAGQLNGKTASVTAVLDTLVLRDGTAGIEAFDLMITSTASTSLATASNPIQIGAILSQNVVFDRTKIQARNNGAASTLSLNSGGGDVVIGGLTVTPATTTPEISLRGTRVSIRDSNHGTLGIVETAVYGGTGPNSNADTLVLENNTNSGISILTPNTSSGLIYFGDPEDVDVGRITYAHSTDVMSFVVAGATQLSMTANTVTATNSMVINPGTIPGATSSGVGTSLEVRAATYVDTDPPSTVTDRTSVSFAIPTFSSDNANFITNTNASTVFIAGAPLDAGGTTNTNSHALQVETGRVWLAGAGSEETPALAIRDYDTGLYSSAVDTLNIVTGGSLAATFSPAGNFTPVGVVRGPGGSDATPTYSFSSDTNTGIYSDTADQLKISTGGTLAATFDSAGNFFPVGDVRGPNGNATTPTYSFSSNTDTGMYAVGTTELAFSLNATPELRITSGSIVIGGVVQVPNGTGAAPSYSFVNGTNSGMYWDNTNNDILFSVDGTDRLEILSTGIIVTGAITATGNITTDGNVTAYAASDARIKKDISTIDGALDKVKALRGVDYTMKDSGRRETGLIAQEVLEVVPEVVREGSDGVYGIAYGNLVGLLVQAMKEQQEQIDALRQELQALK